VTKDGDWCVSGPLAGAVMTNAVTIGAEPVTRAPSAWTRPSRLGVLSMLFSSVVAAVALYHDFTASFLCGIVQGANIEIGIVAVLCGGLAGSVFIALARKRPALLIVALLSCATLLTVALALVARDSATLRGACLSLFGSGGASARRTSGTCTPSGARHSWWCSFRLPAWPTRPYGGRPRSWGGVAR
jgi:hypothetical protein